MNNGSDTPRRSGIARIVEQVVRLSGLSKRALAERAGVAPETLSRITKRGTGDFATVLKVVRAAGLDLAATSPGEWRGPKEPARADSDHRRQEARSLVLHALIAGKVLANPSLLETRVLPTIQRFKAVHAGTGTVHLLDAWERAARAGVDEILRLCTDPSEEGRQLRQASPMTGILLSGERRRVYESFST